MGTPEKSKPTILNRLQNKLRFDRLEEKYPRVAAVLKHDLIWGVIFFLLIIVLLVPLERLDLKVYQLGDVVNQNIIVSQDLRIPDSSATERKRQERIGALKTVYSFDDTQWQSYTSQLETLFREGRETIEAELAKPFQPEIGLTPERLATNEEFITLLQDNILQKASLTVPEDVLQLLTRQQFNLTLQEQIGAIVRAVLSQPVVNTTLYPPLPAGYLLEPIEDQTKSELPILGLSQAREQMRRQAEDVLRGQRTNAALAEWLQTLVEPTATPNQQRMLQLRQQALNVETLFFDVKRGEVIARQGDKITNEDQLAKINYIIDSQFQGLNLIFRSVSLGFFVALFLYAMHKFSVWHKRRRKVNYQLFLLLTLTLTINLTLVKLAFIMGDAFAASLNTSAQDYYLLAPFAVGSMLVTLLVGTQIAALYTIILVFLSGFIFNGNFPILLFALIGGFVGIYGIRQYKERTALIKSGIALGLMNIISIIAINLLDDTLDPAGEIIFSLGMGFTGGLLVAIIVSFLLPIFESLFKIITDIKLLELSNHEHPLLRSLFLNAPGTFQHSIVVGYLAEAASAEINANSLFARVSCLYHDIGKMVKSQYYVENTDDLGKRHDKLSPHMSALIIINHVKEGIELGRSYGLPESIIDIIPQHHGTKLIQYFYEKARNQQKPDDVPVKEEEFRYPGPKPQTREAGIIMIADGVEAAARALDEPTPGRLKGTIKKIIDSTFLDGQLDECDLTLKDLSRIAESFLRILISMKHERIKYPGFQATEKRRQQKSQRQREARNSSEKHQQKQPDEQEQDSSESYEEGPSVENGSEKVGPLDRSEV